MSFQRDIPTFKARGRGLALWTLALAAVALISLEIFVRGVRGYAPDTGFKLAREWSRSLMLGDEALLVVGDSRAAWGVDCEGVEQGVSAAWGVPLTCVNGAVIWGHLPTLLPALEAAEVQPRVLAVAISPASLYSPVFAREFAPIRAGFEPLGALARLDVDVRRWLRRHLTMAEVRPRAVIDMALGRHAQPTRYTQTSAGWNALHIAPEAKAEVRAFQLDAYTKQFLRPLDDAGEPIPDGALDPEGLDAADEAVLRSVSRLRRRGIKVVMFRLPVSQEIADVERGLGLAQRLPRLAERAGVPYRDLTHGGFAVADGSHMDQGEAQIFSAALGRWLSEFR